MSLSIKDIHETLRSIKASGRSVDDLEGLLIHTDDLKDLIKNMPEYHNGIKHDAIRCLGVKLIESPYTQRGTIFRIFKTDDKLYRHINTNDVVWDQGAMVGASGCIPKLNEIPFAMYPELGSIPLTENKALTQFSPEEIAIEMHKIVKENVDQEKSKSKQKEKKDEKRHSETRRIELD